MSDNNVRRDVMRRIASVMRRVVPGLGDDSYIYRKLRGHWMTDNYHYLLRPPLLVSCSRSNGEACASVLIPGDARVYPDSRCWPYPKIDGERLHVCRDTDGPWWPALEQLADTLEEEANQIEEEVRAKHEAIAAEKVAAREAKLERARQVFATE